jgi:hypothetical protein
MIGKRILQNDSVLRFLCGLGALYIRLCFTLGRWQVVNGHIPQRLWDEGRPFILSFWHGRLLMMPYCWRKGFPIHTLISQHRDGRILARMVSHFGIHTIEGSSSHGGSTALRAILAALRAGESIGITPDGPRGPRMRASSGIISIARLSGVPILPVTFAVTRRKVLESWDRFVVAWPLTRGVFVWGEPVTVAKGADEASKETARQELEQNLNEITAKADRMCCHAKIEPGEIAPTEIEAWETEAGKLEEPSRERKGTS